MFADLALIAVATEAIIGYPDAVYRLAGHPVTWIGRLITWCDEAWNSPTLSFETRRWRGVDTLAAAAGDRHRCRASSITSVVAICFSRRRLPAVVRRAGQQPAGAAQPRCACGGRGDRRWSSTASRPAGRPCRRSSGARRASLDEAAVCRAAIESLAENFSDGVVAPLFWMVFAGLPGALAYKAINTADSMIGHKSPRHLAFGWASARCDDLVNLPASRLSALWLVVAAAPARPVAGRRAGDGAARRRLSSLAQCRLAGSRHGRRARHPPVRPAHL